MSDGNRRGCRVAHVGWRCHRVRERHPDRMPISAEGGSYVPALKVTVIAASFFLIKAWKWKWKDVLSPGPP